MSKSRLLEFDAYAAALRARGCEIILAARSQLNWRLDQHKLRRLDVEFESEGGPAVVTGTSPADAFTLSILTEAHSSGQLFNGQRIREFDIIIIPPTQKFIQASEGPFQRVSCLIPCTRLQQFEPSVMTALNDLMRQKRSVMLRSPTLAKYVALIVTTIRHAVANESQSKIDELERTLFEVLATAISAAVESARRTKEFLSGRRAQSYEIAYGSAECFHRPGNTRFHVADFCNALDVTERQLRRSFQVYFGIGPTRLARLHHVNRVRRVLFDRIGRGETIRDILTACKITEPGRFAGEYKAIFGETPSETRRQYLAASHHQLSAMRGKLVADAASR